MCEPVAEAVALALRHGAEAILFNCSQPEVMNAAVLAASAAMAARVSGVPAPRIGVYANAFAPESDAVEPYAGISEIRHDVSPKRYLDWAGEWVRSGATIVGCCCGIGPEHITELRAQFRWANQTPRRRRRRCSASPD